MQKIILITIFLSMISCSFNEGPSYDELRDQEGSKAFDQFITSSKGKELKKYVMNIDQLLKEAEELTDTTMMKDTTLPILHHSLTSYRKSLRLTHKEFMIKKIQS